MKGESDVARRGEVWDVCFGQAQAQKGDRVAGVSGKAVQWKTITVRDTAVTQKKN